MLNRIVSKSRRMTYPLVERVFRNYENAFASRGKTLADIPGFQDRLGGLGTLTYGEWCYTIGLFQGAIHRMLPAERPVDMLDVGCGTARMMLSAYANLTPEDSYTGLDVDSDFITICKRQYTDYKAKFVHYDANNAYYSAKQSNQTPPWPFEDGQFNFLTALSVWTHLKEEDWNFYLAEVGRVLRPGGKAMISFFILDDHYDAALPGKDKSPGAYYPQPKNKWVFDAPSYDSTDWFYPSWANVPEVAIGVRQAAFDASVARAGLRVDNINVGSWKDRPGLFFQDVVEFSKPA